MSLQAKISFQATPLSKPYSRENILLRLQFQAIQWRLFLLLQYFPLNFQHSYQVCSLGAAGVNIFGLVVHKIYSSACANCQQALLYCNQEAEGGGIDSHILPLVIK